MSELYDSVDYNNLKFENVGPTKDVRFYEYKNFKELLSGIKSNQIMRYRINAIIFLKN